MDKAEKNKKTEDDLTDLPGQVSTRYHEKKFILPVLIIFAGAFGIHLVLNLLIKMYPFAVIDEGLYTNIARSLARDGEVAFRAQPVSYPYLLYPMILMPLYLLQRILGGDIFRWIQVFNTLLITSSVFPAALFAFDFTKDHKKAYLTALLTAIMPDMLMGSYSMTEALIWPLALWMVLFANRFFSSGKTRDGLTAALFTGLMYAAKPGAVAVGAAILAFFFVITLMRDRTQLRNSLLPLGLVIVIIGSVYVIFLLFSKNGGSLIGLYTKQTSQWQFKTLLVALEAYFLQIFVFIFACGGIYGIIPLTHMKAYKGSEMSFVLAFHIGLAAALLGTAIFVVPYKWNDSLGKLPLHLRYTAMYIPVMFVFSQKILPDGNKNQLFVRAMAVFVLLSIFPGARVGFVAGKSTEFDSFALSSFADMVNHNGAVIGWVLTAGIILFSLIFLRVYLKNGFTTELQRYCVIFFGIFILINTVSAHFNVYAEIDPSIAKDAREINSMMGDRECLGITQRRYDDYYSYWLDSRLNEPMQQVTTDQIFMVMKDSKGIYEPFVPLDQSPNVNNHETPDTALFVLGKTIAEHLELSDRVKSQKTKNGHFCFAEITPGERWADSMFYGLDDNTLFPETDCALMIWDEDRFSNGKIHLTFTARGDGILFVDGNRFDVNQEEKTFEADLDYDQYIDFRAYSAPVEILSYSTSKTQDEELTSADNSSS